MATEEEDERQAQLWWQERDKEGFKKPFKAVPLNTRLNSLDELEAPLWSPPPAREPFDWIFAGVVCFIAVCAGLAIGIWMNL